MAARDERGLEPRLRKHCPRFLVVSSTTFGGNVSQSLSVNHGVSHREFDVKAERVCRAPCMGGSCTEIQTFNLLGECSLPSTTNP